MRLIAHLSLLLMFTLPATALDATCEIYLNAAEKSASQAARHSITEPGDGSRMEAVIVDGKFFANIEGKWRKMPGGSVMAGERSLLAAIRSGRYPITGCRKAGSEMFEGVATTVIAYRLKLPGTPVEETRAYIGNDGLVYGQVSGETRVRHRYTGVKAPAL